MTEPAPVPALEARGIVKAFPGVVANDHVDFDLRTGEIHALLGENGAGKSTLMNILAGLYRPDAGEILLDGRPVAFGSPRDSIAAGLGMVHQHFTLVPSQTVTENVLLGLAEPRFWLRPKRSEAAIGELAARYGLRVRPRRQDLAAVGRRAAAGRDPQAPLPGRPDPDHGRADRGPRPAGDRRPVPDAPVDDRRWPQRRVHQPQARRGDGHRRPDHGHATGRRDRRGAGAGRHLDDGPGPADGRPRRARDHRAGAAGAGRGGAGRPRRDRRQRSRPARPARAVARGAGG